ncbi:GAF domain-containing protein [Fulvivirga aurantia]|uniref:GAF domain-containing protein n=1 Tax=Fulvivirga aurantia TaxID=2529383 RepID=UPI001CA40E19|nr:GAF domain-containing protein [Fulvivirga aurantia]
MSQNENSRLDELKSYNILDTVPDKELDEIVEIASAICDTPVSLISLVDDERQWFKANVGFDKNQTPRSQAFCQHALNKPHEILVVSDPVNDDRFRDNPLVTGEPFIRFYAGAPLETPNGHVLGTLCVIDNKPREISENQKKALGLLANKVMSYLNDRKLLDEQSKRLNLTATRLKKITDQAPGALFQFEMALNGTVSFRFISNGISRLHPELDPQHLMEKPLHILDYVHPQDIRVLRKKIQDSFENLSEWNFEYRVLNGSRISWHQAKATPERKDNGNIIWYGIFQDITDRKEYEQTLEEILFDISHGLRGPVATLQGLMRNIEQDNYSTDRVKRYVKHVKTTSAKLDTLTRKLNETYSKKKEIRDVVMKD